MVARWCLAALWGALGVTKALAPAPFVAFVAQRLSVGIDTSRLLSWAWIALELLIALGVAVALPQVWRSAFVVGSLALAGVLLVGNVVLGRGADANPCGCFGALAEATYLRRLLVCGVLVFLSTSLLRMERLVRGSAHG
jgi:hypothetical protein